MDPIFANRIVDGITAKRQQYVGSETAGPSKRPRKKDAAAKPNIRLDREKHATFRTLAMASEIAQRHLIVALNDRSNAFG